VGSCALLLIAASSAQLALAAPAATPKLRLEMSRSEGSALRAKGERDDRVSMNFPEPTDIRDIIRFVSLWTGRTTILDRTVGGKVQILAPDLLPRDEALARFATALDQLGLASVEHHGIVQILPKAAVTDAAEQRREALAVPELPLTKDLVRLDYPEPTDIRAVVHDVARWSRRTYVLDRNVNGKIQIFSPRPQSKAQAYRVFLTALDQLGLAEADRGDATQIVPLRNFASRRPLRLDLPPVEPEGDVRLAYEQPTTIRKVLENARPWYGRDLVLDRDVAGKVEILTPGPLSRQAAYGTLVSALDLLGYTAVEQGGAVVIVPYAELEPREPGVPAP
jgi:type II secretory pathway component GspD/PulD (secretin)